MKKDKKDDKLTIVEKILFGIVVFFIIVGVVWTTFYVIAPSVKFVWELPSKIRIIDELNTGGGRLGYCKMIAYSVTYTPKQSNEKLEFMIKETTDDEKDKKFIRCLRN